MTETEITERIKALTALIDVLAARGYCSLIWNKILSQVTEEFLKLIAPPNTPT